MGDLKHDLKYDVELLKSSTVHDAIAIAMQIDAKLRELKSGTSRLSQNVKLAPTFQTNFQNTKIKTTLPVKNLSPDEV